MALWLALFAAMALGTTFKSVTAGASGPAAFDATVFAQQKWPGLVTELEQKAVDVATLAAAVDANLTDAGKKYGQDLGANSYAFAVTATGTVTAVDENFITLSVADMPAGDAVRIPLGMAVNGLAIRDATGTIHFGDFTNQSDYQDVANAFQALSRTDVIGNITPGDLKGKRVTVVGAFTSGGPAHSYSISPVKIEVGS